MSNNRHLINNLQIMRPTQLLDKGLPLPFFEGKYLVEPGWCAVISVGGAFQEILQSGTHFLGQYHMFREVHATQIDLRRQSMTVSTTREFSIAQPIPVEVNLDLQIEYQVVDARRVATEITTPLTSLFDRVIQAVRGSIANAHIDEIRKQGEGIGRATFQKLQAMQLGSDLGLEVKNVLVTSIKATDAGQDALAGLQMKEFTKIHDWQIENTLIAQTQLSPQWFLINRPEIYAQIIAGNTEVIKELIDKGLMDPAAFASLPALGSGSIPYTTVLPGLGMSSLSPGGQQNTYGVPDQKTSPQLPAGSGNVHSRIEEEIRMLERNIPGIKIKASPGQNEQGILDGSYGLAIRVPRNSGGNIDIRLSFLKSYPQTPPDYLEVIVNEEMCPFESSVLRHWSGQYILEIVREVKQYFG